MPTDFEQLLIHSMLERARKAEEARARKATRGVYGLIGDSITRLDFPPAEAPQAMPRPNCQSTLDFLAGYELRVDSPQPPAPPPRRQNPNALHFFSRLA